MYIFFNLRTQYMPFGSLFITHYTLLIVAERRPDMLSRQRNEWGAKIALQIDFELKNLKSTYVTVLPPFAELSKKILPIIQQ
jgi:hypothetical protein